jgi:hypothetical protein
MSSHLDYVTANAYASAAASQPDLGAELEAGLHGLRPPTLSLLRALVTATPEMRRLVLTTAPAGVRFELMAAGICEEPDDARGLQLSAVGEAALELLSPLDDEEQRELGAEAARAVDHA